MQVHGFWDFLETAMYKFGISGTVYPHKLPQVAELTCKMNIGPHL
jgi:hypothetical protein